MARKRSPLVSQFLENVSRKALRDYEPVIREFVRRRHGIYVLYRKNRVQYIGLAQNLRNRIKHHLRDRHADSWDRFSVYLTIADSHMKELESLLLRIAKPKGNRAGGRFAKAENLNLKMRQLIREQQRKDLDDVMGIGQRRPTVRQAMKVLEDGGTRPVLAAYSNRPKLLRGRYKGKLHRARVLRDGRIRYDGKTFNSPSLAAAAARGRPTANGWWFWTYQRAPGEWVRLGELRR
jgi:hypothetical protein